MIKKFSEGNADDLYEILIQYHSHFMNPLNQSQQFFNGFIQYVIKKENKFEIFKRAMKYIKDIETYLFVINENKNQIFDKYKELKIKPIELGPTLKLIKYNIDKCFTGEKTNSDNESDEEDNTEGLNRLQAVECECDKIIELIEKLIKFSEKERTLAIYLKVTFWINLIKQYDIPDWENINNLHKLRELFKKYNNLINFLYEEKNEDDTKDKKNKKKIKKEGIKYEINGYLERDEFALNLNKNIKGFFEKAKDRLTNAEILGTVEKFNPFFSIRNKEDKEKYKNKRDTYIFDYIKFNKTTPTFILNFKKWNFEIIFEEIISDYINKITGKIKDIQTFGNIIKLIEVKRIKEEKQKDYFRILKEKYKNVIENEIKNINKEEELGKAISIIAEFVSKLFSYEKNNSFIDERIKKLDDKIKSLIYIEIITKYNGDEYQKMKNYIYDIYLNNLGTKEGRDNVIKLVKKLTGEEKKFFTYEKLLKKCVFTKEEFFSNHKNYKIKTLCELKKELEKEQLEKETKKEGENEEEKYLDIPALSEKGNESAKILSNTLDDIIQDLDNEKIIKKDLEKFLRIKKMKNQQKDKEDANKKQEEINTSSKRKEPQAEKQNEPTEKTEEDEVIEKLGLISLVLNQYNPEIKYAEYKQKIENINKTVDKLNLIKDSLMIFHKNKFNKDIDAITEIIKEIENNPIINFKNEERQKGIKAFEKHDPLCDEINKVKDFLLFKKIFENAQGSDQLERFEDATKKLSALKGKLTLKENSNENTLKEKSNEDTLNIEIIFKEKDFKNVLKDIKDELSRKDESKSELFAKQMIDYFNITNKSVIKDLKMLINSKKYENILISIDYFFKNFSDKKVILTDKKNLSDLPLDTLKSTLNQLTTEDIYNHESSSQYYKIYTAMYEKKEAIDFLIKNINKERDLRKKLIKNLDPTNRSISIKDINDTIKCLKHFNKLISKNSSEIMKYIKSLNEDEIKQFVSYSKKFGSIIGLYNKTGKDNFSEVYEIVKDASLIFNLDGEDF